MGAQRHVGHQAGGFQGGQRDGGQGQEHAGDRAHQAAVEGTADRPRGGEVLQLHAVRKRAQRARGWGGAH